MMYAMSMRFSSLAALVSGHPDHQELPQSAGRYPYDERKARDVTGPRPQATATARSAPRLPTLRAWRSRSGAAWKRRG